MLKLKRAYEPVAEQDGYRVLVERLWPRGLKKENASLDAWLKQLAPSDALRRWYGHDPSRWTEFSRRYRHELDSAAVRALLGELAQRAKRSAVTLVFSTRDPELSNARILAAELGRMLRVGKTKPRTPREVAAVRKQPRARSRSKSKKAARRL